MQRVGAAEGQGGAMSKGGAQSNARPIVAMVMVTLVIHQEDLGRSGLWVGRRTVLFHHVIMLYNESEKFP